MKFFADANLPYKLAIWLRQLGFDALHTDDLPDKERTSITNANKYFISTQRGPFHKMNLLK